jgi:hypothetical protein
MNRFQIGDLVRVKKCSKDTGLCSHLLGILIEINKENICAVDIPMLKEIRFYHYDELEMEDG